MNFFYDAYGDHDACDDHDAYDGHDAYGAHDAHDGYDAYVVLCVYRFCDPYDFYGHDVFRDLYEFLDGLCV